MGTDTHICSGNAFDSTYAYVRSRGMSVDTVLIKKTTTIKCGEAIEKRLQLRESDKIQLSRNILLLYSNEMTAEKRSHFTERS